MVESVSVPFFFVSVFDTNNLLKNRITSGMHIYSSPRNMSVNLGSVSTKHEQHLLPYRLYPQQIWHCAHSFCFPFPFLKNIFWSFKRPYLCHYYYYFILFLLSNTDHSFGEVPQNYLPHLPLFKEPLSSPLLIHLHTAPLNDVHAVCFSARAGRWYWGGQECWNTHTHSVTNWRGAQAPPPPSPSGVVTSLLRASSAHREREWVIAWIRKPK